MTGILRRNLIVLAVAALGAVAASAQNSFTVDVPAVVSSDEDFRVVFTATGDGKVSDFSEPSFEGFEVLAGPLTSTSSSFQMINGKTTQSRSSSYTFVLRSTGTGKFTIGQASVRIGKEAYSTEPVTVEVVEGRTASSQDTQSQSAGGDLMLRMTVSKTRAVIGEPIVVTLKLYVQNSAIGGFENVRFPTFDGFWSQEIEAPQNIQFVRENYGGKVYNSALLRRYMLLPQQTGTLTIDAAEIVCLIQERVRSHGSGSVFDDFFESYQTVRRRVSSQPVSIEVSPLPSGAPSSFTGGVGSFRLSAGFDKDSVSAHEAVSLKVTVSGTGNINLVTAPDVSLPSEFEAYDVRKSDKVSTGQAGASGDVTFEYPFIPRVPGDYAVPPVEFSYYDIGSGTYRTLSSGPLHLKVGEGDRKDATVVAPGAGKQSVRNINEDIRFIAPSYGKLRREGALAVGSPLWYAAAALVLLLTAVAWTLLSRRAARMEDIAGTRNRKALKVARARLRNASVFLKQNLYTAFYEELHKAIVGYISDKLTLPPADLSRDRIAGELRARGRDEALIQELFEIMDACEYARYAPSSGSEAMDGHYRQAVKVISEIER
ncbi:MAG TPA: BatD family protein [Candidatus Coprenecus pullistercoris]|nr:BatD family protein [Candidatus Coprenecus pullistercoris]